jgi:hypothetical protein
VDNTHDNGHNDSVYVRKDGYAKVDTPLLDYLGPLEIGSAEMACFNYMIAYHTSY